MLYKRQFFSECMALILILLIFFIIPGCKREKNTADKSPTGMVINTTSGARTAPLMAKVVYGVVPAEFQPNNALVNLKESDTVSIAKLRARDLLQPLPEPPYGIVGYTQFPDNNPDDRYGPFTNIYFVKSRPQEDIAHTVVHEWGHFAYYRMATEGEQEKWWTLSANVPPAKGYEGKSSNEQFAEYFAMWCASKKGPVNPPIPDAVKKYFDDMKSRLHLGGL